MNGKKMIVVYHRIGETQFDYNRIVVNPGVFVRQLDYYQEKYLILPLEELHEYDGKLNAISITFDDGYEDYLTTAFPIMKRRNIPSTVFLCSGRIDRSDEIWMNEIIRMCFFHSAYIEEVHLDYFGQDIKLFLRTIDDRVKTYQILRRMFMQISIEKKEEYLKSIQKQLGLSNRGRMDYRMLSSSHIKTLADEELVAIGAHTVSHPLLAELNEEEYCKEIRESIQSIEKYVQKEINLFSYPFGGSESYNNQIMKVLQREGIKRAYTVDNRYLKDSECEYAIPRVYMYNIAGDNLDRYLENIGNEKARVADDPQEDYFGNGDDDFQFENNKVLVWGTGQNAITVMNSVQKKNIEIIAFIESENLASDNMFYGKPIWNCSEMLEYAKNEVVIVKNNHDFRIVENLKKMGKNKIHWWI